MVAREGLLVATLELHRRSSADADRNTPALLSLVVELTFSWVQIRLLQIIKKGRPKGHPFLIMVAREGLLVATLELHRRALAEANRHTYVCLALVVKPTFRGFKSASYG